MQACRVLRVTLPAMGSYQISGAEVITITSLPAACVASAHAYTVMGMAARRVTPRQACGGSGGECSGHGVCIQSGPYCSCGSGWAGTTCEASCAEAKCAEGGCPSCSSGYNVGSWYEGYAVQ